MMATEQTRSLTQSILSTPSALNPPSPTLCISLYVRRCYGVNHLMTARRVAFMCACVCESACACVGMPSVSQVRHARCSVHKTCSGVREQRFYVGGEGGLVTKIGWRMLSPCVRMNNGLSSRPNEHACADENEKQFRVNVLSSPTCLCVLLECDFVL